jgi:hypothetical protein
VSNILIMSARGTLLFSALCTALLAFLLSYYQHYIGAQTYCYRNIVTLDPLQPSAQCFRISQSGKFVNIFNITNYESTDYMVPTDPGYVLPGLWDGHGHLLQYGEMLQSVNLFGVKSLNEAVQRVRAHASQRPSEGTKEQWIRGIGWDQAAFSGGQMPTAVGCMFGSFQLPGHDCSKFV